MSSPTRGLRWKKVRPSLSSLNSVRTDSVHVVAKRLSALWAEANDLLAVAKSGMDAAEGVTKAAVDEAQKGQLDLDLLEKQKAEKLAALATSSQISPEIMKQYEKRKTEVGLHSFPRLDRALIVVAVSRSQRSRSSSRSSRTSRPSVLRRSRRSRFVLPSAPHRSLLTLLYSFYGCRSWRPSSARSVPNSQPSSHVRPLQSYLQPPLTRERTGMNLLGEVRIAKHEDYSKWGIEILVSFRESEELHVLTAHRQSGGVSPIVFSY